MDDELLAAVAGATWAADERFTARERAALDFTEAFWHDHHRVDRGVVHAVLPHFTPAEFIEIATLVAQFKGMGQLFAVLGIPNPAPRTIEETT